MAVCKLKTGLQTDKCGQVLLEFAVGLPLLLLLLFFVAESGYFLVASQAVPTALHDGSILALSMITDNDVTSLDQGLISKAMVQSLARPGVITPESHVRLETVGEKSLGRGRIILTVSARYKGITPLAKMFNRKKLGGKLILPVGDWRVKE